MALLSALIDDFNSNSIRNQWSVVASNPSSVRVQNQRLEIIHSANIEYNSLASAAYYNMTSNYAFVQIVDAGDQSIATHIAVFGLTLDANNAVYFQIGQNQISVWKRVANANTMISSAAYSRALHSWVRVRELGGSIYFDTASNGYNWTNFTSTTNPFNITSVQLYMQAGTYSAASPSYAYFDNFNTTSLGSSSSVVRKPVTKTYLYKWYNADGSYGGVWRNVTDVPQFTQEINSPGTTMTVYLGRSPDNRAIILQTKTDQAGNIRTDQADNSVQSKVLRSNTVGAGSDVDINLAVDVYVFYGQFETKTDQAGNIRTDQAGNTVQSATGAPNGRRVFSGFILDYELGYGSTGGQDQAQVIVTLASNGYELSQDVVRDSGADTGVVKTLTNVSGESAISTIVNTNPGKMHTVGTLATTGTVISPTFQLNTDLSAINLVVSQMGAGFWWRGDVADNGVYLQPVGTSAKHVFLLGRHLETVRLKRTMEGMTNDAYFVGGVPGGGTVQKFKHRRDAGSYASYPKRGLFIKQDQRYTLDSSILTYLNGAFGQYAQPIYTTTITISAATYDIEMIRLGDMVSIRNTGNVDNLILQVVNRQYTPYSLTMQLGGILRSAQDITTDVESKVDTLTLQTIPNAPA